MTPAGAGIAASARVVIAGGGIAGLEALLAIRDLAGDRAEITVVAPDREFTMKPQSVEEPFTGQPAESHELGPAAAELGADFIPSGLTGVDTGARIVTLENGTELGYDRLLVCVGAKAVPPFVGVTTFEASGASLGLAMLLAKDDGKLTFVVPTRNNWPLPIYELALMTERHQREAGRANLSFEIVTPESAPLYLFGSAAEKAVSDLLKARGIALITGARVWQAADNQLILDPGETRLHPSRVVTIPELRGRFLPGLPSDFDGFIPVDEHCRVKGIDGVYAAGDCADFPVKQGGIGTQQADAAAEHLAASLGADLTPRPFTPVLRGMLLTGSDSLKMQHSLGEAEPDEGKVSDDSLWWPPLKVSGRYLSAWLAKSTQRSDVEPPEAGLEIEVSLPHEWHGEPMLPRVDHPT